MKKIVSIIFAVIFLFTFAVPAFAEDVGAPQQSTIPSQEPSEPLPEPTVEPTPQPEPSVEPTPEPTPEPSVEPSQVPSSEPTPSEEPSIEPTASASAEPKPSDEPTEQPSETPTQTQEAIGLEQIIEIARTDGAKAAQILNDNESDPLYLKTLEDLLILYYTENPNAQRDAFLANIGEAAKALCDKYKAAYDERQKDPAALGYMPGEIIVSMRKNAPSPQKLEQELECADYSDIASPAETRKGEIGVFEIPVGETVASAIALFEQQPGVEYAQPNYLHKITQAQDTSQTEAVPNLNDPGLSQQWYLNDIKVPEAWEFISKVAHKKVRVAVIDTGIDANHEDLQANVNKSLCVNATDDDLLQNTTDSGEHGTHVSGIIAADANNSKGIVGVAAGKDNSIVELITAKASFDGKYFYDENTLRAIYWAIDQDARVINMSLGSYNYTDASKDAVDAAVNSGIAVVCAAGNDNTAQNNYPSDHESAISVIATGSDRKRASFSNYGEKKDISAPGVEIYSTVPNGYENFNGTSMASPVVAAVCAMMLSVNPNLTVNQIKTILYQTADDVGDPGFDVYTANGIVNAYNAVKKAYETSGAIPAPGVKPAAPTGAVAEIRSSTSSIVKCNNVPGANGYEFSRSLNGVNYTVLGTNKAPLYRDSNLTTGTKYYYKIRAYRLNGDQKIYGDYSAAIEFTPQPPPKPRGITVKGLPANAVEIKWQTIPDVGMYFIEKSTDGKNFKEIPTMIVLMSESAEIAYCDSGLSLGTYYYRVRGGFYDMYTPYSDVVSYTQPGSVQGDFEYTIMDSTEAAVIKYNGSATDLTIPDTLGGKPVTQIGHSSFKGCDSLNSVVLPSTLKVIDGHAFEQCRQLKSVTVKEGVTEIWSSAFAETRIENIVLPKSLKTLEYGPFYDCNYLRRVRFLGDAPTANIELAWFPLTLGTGFPSDYITLYTAGAKGFSNHWYSYPAIVEGTEQPKNMTLKQTGDFSVSITWDPVDFSDGYEVERWTKGTGRYEKVSTQTQTTFSDSALTPDIYDYRVRSFKNNGDEKIYSAYSSVVECRIYYVEGDYKYEINSNGTVAIAKYTGNAKQLEIPSSFSGRPVTHLNYDSFANTNLTDVILPYGIKVIGGYAFEKNANLKTVSIPSSVTNIGVRAFSLCPTLEYLEFPASLTTLDEWVVEGSSNLKKIKFMGNAPKTTNETLGNGLHREYVTVYKDGATGFSDQWRGFPAMREGGVVPPRCYVGASVALESGNSVKITWYNDEDVDGYEIERSLNGTDFTRIANTTVKSYTDSNLLELTTYYYRVRAFNKDGSSKVYGTYSRAVTIKTSVVQPLAPQNVKATVVMANKVKLTWDCVDGASGYKIWRKANGSYSQEVAICGSPNMTEYEDRNLDPNQTYSYVVYSYKYVESKYYTCNNAVTVVAKFGLTDGDYKYGVSSDDTAVITKYTGSGSHIEIPSKLGGKNVEGIGGYSFYDSNIVSATLPQGVKTLYELAFVNCVSLETIILPNTLKRIGMNAFCTTPALKSLDIPESVEYIDLLAFQRSGLESLTIPSSVKKIGSDIVLNCTNLKWIRFLGDAPEIDRYLDSHNSLPSDYVTIYKKGAKGFTNPWCGYPTQEEAGAPSAPDAPTKPTLTAGYGQLTAKWNAADGANGYEVYMSTSASSIGSMYKDVDANTLSLSIPDLTAGTKYYISVRAYITADGKKYYSDYSPANSAVPTLAKVATFKATTTGFNTVNLNWSKAAGAQGYIITYSTDNKSYYSYGTFRSGSIISYTATSLSPSNVYYFKIQPYGATVKGSLTASNAVRPTGSTPTGFTATVRTPSNAYMSWDAVTGAHGYEIWRSIGTGSYTFLNSTNSSTRSFTDTAVAPSTTYNYMVRAYVTVGGKKYYGGWAKYANIRYPIYTPSNFTATVKSPTSAQLTWDGIPYASGYEIYRSIGTGSYSLLRTNNASTRSLTDTSIVPGTTYNYIVRAFITVSGRKYYSGWAKYTNIRYPIYTPSNFTATVKSPTSASMTWGATPSASGYEIWRSIGTGSYSLLRTNNSSTLNCTDTTIVPGTTYNYIVRAFITVSGRKYYSGWAKYPNVKPTVGTPTNITATKDGTTVSLKWDAVTGATTYELMRSVDGSSYTLYKTLKTNSYTDTNIDPAKTYDYKVRACLVVGGKKTGDYSQVATVEAQGQTPAEITEAA